MDGRLYDLVRHNGWATAQLLSLCQGLDESTLQATVPGTAGTILETLQHLIDAESSYLYRLTGAWTTYPVWDDPLVGIDVLIERAAELATVLEQFVTTEWDSERLGTARGDGKVFDVRAGVFLTQLIHHANLHRAHVCTILGALGLEPPDLSGWDYALETGRMTEKPG